MEKYPFSHDSVPYNSLSSLILLCVAIQQPRGTRFIQNPKDLSPRPGQDKNVLAAIDSAIVADNWMWRSWCYPALVGFIYGGYAKRPRTKLMELPISLSLLRTQVHKQRCFAIAFLFRSPSTLR